MIERVIQQLQTAVRPLGAFLFAVVLVQAGTGLALSLWYVPSRAPAVTDGGKALAITSEMRVDTVGGFLDTLGDGLHAVMVPAHDSDLVPSQAAASIVVGIENAYGGGIVRSIHRNNTIWLYTIGLLWFFILLVTKSYNVDARLWRTSTAFLVLVLASAWSGRLLPDDVYAEISSRIVGHELQEAPFGNFIAKLFGVDPHEPMLSRTFILHMAVGVGAAFLLARYRKVSAQKILLTAVVISVCVLVSALLPLEVLPLRDTLHGNTGEVHVSPWWVVSPLHTLVSWFGAELTGYLILGGLIALFALPLKGKHS